MNIPHPSPNDTAVLDHLRFDGPLSVTELCDRLEVTATAIRQRLSRLEAGALIERYADRRDRGRPVFKYRLTAAGLAAVGNNLADLAEALWLEVLNLPDSEVRAVVLEGVLKRLSDKYGERIQGNTIAERLESIAALFRQRRIPFVVEAGAGHSIMRVVGCPYPGLSVQGEAICDLEQKLVAKLLNAPVALDNCQCGSTGGKCCTFSAADLAPTFLQSPARNLADHSQDHSFPESGEIAEAFAAPAGPSHQKPDGNHDA